MSRQRIVGWAVVVLLAVAAVGLWLVQRRRDIAARTPGWTDPRQPPDGVADAPTQLTADQSWAANRCRSFTSCCVSNTAGMRIRRNYPDSLAESDNSVVRVIVSGEVG